jgi:sulfur relay (sulfurtransferase) DsrC/TusE family protein
MNTLQKALETYKTQIHESVGAEKGIDLIVAIEEEILKIQKSLQNTFNTREETEKFITQRETGKSFTISDLLDTLSAKIEAVLKSEEDIEQVLHTLKIEHKKLEGRIVPPDERKKSEKREEERGSEYKEKITFPKFSLFLSALREMGVYTDDIIVRYGKVEKNEMRNESYIVIEIPRLGKTVVLSNEYGEASFVFSGYLSDEELLEKGKTYFWDHPLFLSYVKFYQGKETEWQEEMKQILEEKNTVMRKIDIPLLQKARDFFEEKECSPENWMEKKAKEKRELQKQFQKKYNFSFMRLCTELGLKKEQGSFNPVNSSEDLLMLGKAIFGENHTEFLEWTERFQRKKDFKKLSLEEKKRELQQFFKEDNGWNPKNWMEKSLKEKQDLQNLLFHEYDFGFSQLCKEFGFKKEEGCFEPARSSEDLLMLGKAIFGKNHTEFLEWTERFQRKKDFERLSLEEKKEKVQQFFEEDNGWNPKNWMAKNQNEKKALEKKIQEKYDFGFMYICNEYELKKQGRFNFIGSSEDFLMLGKAIFGENCAEFIQWKKANEKKKEQKERFDLLSLEEKKRELQQFFKKDNEWNPGNWMKKTIEEKRELQKQFQKKYGFCFSSLCTKFELKKEKWAFNPTSSSPDFLMLGQEIFGENCAEFLEWTERFQRQKNFKKLSLEDKKRELQQFFKEDNKWNIGNWMKKKQTKKKH